MKDRGKWVVLTVGVLLISATCGFGFQTKATLTQYENAKLAFAKRDWDSMVANLSPSSNPRVPTRKALGEFIKLYLDPAIDGQPLELATRQWNSSMVPIPNEEISYQRVDPSGRNIQFIRLSYTDNIAWFDMPIGGRRFGVFQGKRVAVNFYSMFYRAAALKFPSRGPARLPSSLLAFVKSEQETLTRIGILPIHAYSSGKTWEDFEKELQERIRKISQ